MLNLSQQQLGDAVAQLDQAIYNHDQWYKSLVRTLLARLTPDTGDLAPDAHHRCRFGQWYDSETSGPLGEHPSFIALNRAHENMHASAARLLNRAMDDLPLSPSYLDQFENVLDHLRLELQSLRRELVETAENRDALTGVRNRAGLLPFLREQQALVRRKVNEVNLAMIDLDHFKAINDEHGHPAGDRMLQATAQCLRDVIRPYDRIYRYGGEEFLICMPDTSVDDAMAVGERFRETVEACKVQHGSQDTVMRVTASVGIAALLADAQVEAAIDNVDRALYSAKKQGRNRVVLFEN